MQPARQAAAQAAAPRRSRCRPASGSKCRQGLRVWRGWRRAVGQPAQPAQPKRCHAGGLDRRLIISLLPVQRHDRPCQRDGAQVDWTGREHLFGSAHRRVQHPLEPVQDHQLAARGGLHDTLVRLEPCLCMGLWLVNSTRVAGVHAPAKPVCGSHVVGTVVL